MSDDLGSRFTTFFQAYWLTPVAGLADRLMGFHGTAQAFSAVIRETAKGAPLTTIHAELVNGSVELDLQAWMPGTQNICLTLFGEAAQAEQYFTESAAGWTTAEQQVIDDPARFQMIPDVSFAPQLQVRASRDRCNPEDPESVELMNAELRLNYQRFSAYDGKVIPEVTVPGLKGLLIGAPGDPEEWIPPN